jgi:endonuclease/exonuclease/phosphatase family metal-dependent hydrolase
VKLVTYNIQYGLGKDNRYDLARIAREIEDADVIALQEVEHHWVVEHHWRRSSCVDSPAVLGTKLPEQSWPRARRRSPRPKRPSSPQTRSAEHPGRASNVNGPHRCGPHLFWRVVQCAD